jgi:hypothetical protein
MEAQRVPFMTMAELQTVTARCQHCRGKMQVVRHIRLADMPDLYVFYCVPCQYAETIKQEPSAAMSCRDCNLSVANGAAESNA